MRIFKAGAKTVAVLLFIVLVNWGLTFVIEPTGSKSQVMWHDYYEQSDIDTVYVGTSQGERGFDPAAIDKECGTSSYNMCTPSQLLEESFLGIKQAYKDHHIKRVVLSFEVSLVQSEDSPSPGGAYIRNKDRGKPLQFAKDALPCLTDDRFYGKKDSINWMFPWVINHVDAKPQKLYRNIKMKLDGTSIADAAMENEKGWTYYGKGYGNYDRVYDYNPKVYRSYLDTYGKSEPNDRKMQTLADICDYCADHDIELDVICTPLPAYDILEYDGYFDKLTGIKSLVEEHGAHYYDFNLARPELFDQKPEYFADYQHMNTEGGRIFSEGVAKLFQHIDAGDDVDDLFYAPEDYASHIDYIDMVTYKTKNNDDGSTKIDASVLAGEGVQAEYQFLVKNKDTGKWDVLQDYSDESSYTFDPDKPGTYRVCVNARKVGSTAEYERCRTFSITK